VLLGQIVLDGTFRCQPSENTHSINWRVANLRNNDAALLDEIAVAA
jgi:hypothetical protein